MKRRNSKILGRFGKNESKRFCKRIMPNQIVYFQKWKSFVSKKLMGNQFEICIIADSQESAEEPIQIAIMEIQRIEKLLTTFSESSQTNQINQNAGIKPVQVDQELIDLIKRANRISEITQGAFDLSYGSIDKSLWNFDVSMTSLPSAETARKSVRLINYKNILLDEKNSTVFLKEKE